MYRDGELPGHTKLYFTEYKILSIQNLMARNALIFMQKIRNFTSLLPRSIRDTIYTESPRPESTYEICENWFKFDNNHYFRKYIFCKGPLLIYARSNIDQTLSLASLLSIRAYLKRHLKDALLRKQSSGNSTEWENENFAIFNIDGLRQSRVSMYTVIR